MWVARDVDGRLYIYLKKPVKVDNVWEPVPFDFSVLYPVADEISDWFPNVKWEDDEPTEVELVKK